MQGQTDTSNLEVEPLVAENRLEYSQMTLYDKLWDVDE